MNDTPSALEPVGDRDDTHQTERSLPKPSDERESDCQGHEPSDAAHRDQADAKREADPCHTSSRTNPIDPTTDRQQGRRTHQCSDEVGRRDLRAREVESGNHRVDEDGNADGLSGAGHGAGDGGQHGDPPADEVARPLVGAGRGAQSMHRGVMRGPDSRR